MFIWDIVAKKVNYNSNYNTFYFDNIYSGDSTFSISIFLIFAIFIFVGFISFSIIYRPNLILLLLITVPILVIGLLFGHNTSYYSYELLVLVWIVVSGMRTLNHKLTINISKDQFVKKHNKYYLVVKERNRIISSNVGIILGIISVIIFTIILII